MINMDDTTTVIERNKSCNYGLLVVLTLVFALGSNANSAPIINDGFSVGTIIRESIQNYSGQEGFDPYSFDGHDPVNSNENLRSNSDRQRSSKARRKPWKDCRTKQAEILQRLQDQLKTSKPPNNDSKPKNYQYLMPHYSPSDNTTHFSLDELEKFSYFDSEHVPRCTPSGRYAPIQCHKIGYCWCVNKFGQALKNSASEVNSEPNCDPTKYESEDLESLIISEAKSSRLKGFLNGGNSSGFSADSMEGSPMDFNEDELNTSQNASSQEDDFNRRVKASQEPSLALVPNECTLSRDNAKIRASKHSDKEAIWIPECDPDSPNLYAQKQCHKSKVCWCVEQITGLPLRTNEQLSVKLNLNCSAIRPKIGEDAFNALRNNRLRISGSSTFYRGFGDSCDADQRAEFVRSILNQFRQQIAEHLKANPVPSHLPSINPYSLSESNTSAWKFHLIDTDHNGTLDEREWSRFRNNFKLIDKVDELQRQYSGSRMSPLKILRQQRRCWRAFLNYCSGGVLLVNSVSLKEWTSCTELPSKDMKGPTDDMALLNVLAAIARSKSRNPFSSLLKPD